MDVHNTLVATAHELVAEGKGILAADESSGTIKRRLDSINVPSTEENRRAYREILFTTPGVEAFVSGIILYDETLRQSAQDGTAFPQLLTQRGIIPGIKVDKGTTALPGFPGETITEGLDGLRGRLAEYYALGARFTKWRAVITIDAGIPTDYCLEANAHALARYAALSQEAGLVPIVEPEVLMDGAHTIERCEEVTTATLQRVFAQLHAHRVLLEGMLLKPNMVVSGKSCPQQASVDEVAQATLRCFRRDDPGGSARHCVSLRRAKRPESHGASQCHECLGGISLATEFFLWTRPAGPGAGSLAWGRGQCPDGAAVFLSAGEMQWCGALREIYQGHGRGRCLRGACGR